MNYKLAEEARGNLLACDAGQVIAPMLAASCKLLDKPQRIQLEIAPGALTFFGAAADRQQVCSGFGTAGPSAAYVVSDTGFNDVGSKMCDEISPDWRLLQHTQE